MMKIAFFIPFLCFFFFFSVFCQVGHCSTVLVDGVSEWKNPTVHVGDTVIFRHKYQYDLYIFQNQQAFTLCDFTQATLLTKPGSNTFTWHPSRPGNFYFTFNNGSLNACQHTQKFPVKVSSESPSPSPENLIIPPESPPMPAPAPTTGGIVSSSPAFPWPYRPHEQLSPGPAPVASLSPDKGGIPFINSNPAVPLPTGEVDSATIRPLPISADGKQEVVGLLQLQMALLCAMFLML
ncbi:hypothetical protein BT93_F1934 [Corymbia citriodora subsp. variegata]|nr:hypothetical protein BT93_F1934 [Corymbia citriodora subsp. variegata]